MTPQPMTPQPMTPQPTIPPTTTPVMNSTEALEALIKCSGHQPVVFTTGYTCRRAYALHDAPNHFYMTGSMGLAGAIGTGLALADPATPVLVVDGDGSLLMNPANSLLATAYDVHNLHHVVLDNGRNESTGGQPTVAAGVRFPHLASGLGYRDARTVNDVHELAGRLGELTRDGGRGPTFTHCPVTDAGAHPGERVDIPLPEISQRLADWLAQHRRGRV
ncbi:thiamine pyrophosphate-dependent enzyme [Spirillospora sp. NBC_00431]